MNGGNGNGSVKAAIGRPIRRSPYAVLNLPQRSESGYSHSHETTENKEQRPISDDRIRDSYKRLSRLLHPDKRPPGKEREDAQEIFIELQHAYEILVDPALRQAYDHFGHSAVAHVRHNKYASNSLYRNLSALHDDGRPSEALYLLQIVLEDVRQEKRQKEWECDFNVEVNMHAAESRYDDDDDDAGNSSMNWPEVSSTNVSLVASVPMPPQNGASPFPAQSSDTGQQTAQQRKRRLQLSIGGQSNLENGLGSTLGMLSANYQPLAQTSITSDIAMGYKQLRTSISSSTKLANGTGMSATMTRQQELGCDKDGELGFGFTSHRTLSMFHGRTVHAMFALGLGSNLMMTYGILSLTTWGFSTTPPSSEEDAPPPQIAGKLSMGSQFPVEVSIDQSHLFGSPHRSGRASVAWSPALGCKLKAMISRTIAKRCSVHESEFTSSLAVGVEHTPLSGLKWLIRYQRPEGVTVSIPIFVTSFLSPAYWHRVVWVATLSWLLDESIEEWMGYTSSSDLVTKSDASKAHKTLSNKVRTNEKEQKWLSSSKAKQDAELQLSIISPVAEMKRQREESIGGLVILTATYALTSKMYSKTSLDVTQQLQFWVENSQLYLPPSSKSVLLGFYDLLADRALVRKDINQSSLSELTHRSIDTMNVWLSRLDIGGEIGPTKDNCSSDNGDRETVILTVRYKHKGSVFEMCVGDDDELELPSSDATILGSSDRVS